MPKPRFLYSIFFMLIILQQMTYSEKVTIKGLDIQYNEMSEIMTASGNAELNHPDFKVLAESITYNKKTGEIIGKNNVELIRDNQIILSEKFNYNAKNDIIEINKLWLELTTTKQQQFFSSASVFKDFGSYKKGTHGQITTCDYDPPHYYFKAESFTIYPEKKIIAQNVRLVNPVLFLPLGFWSPAYIFDLGKRKVVYLMPIIGNNTIEGGFFKSQFDYVLNDNYTGSAYIDYLSKKGIGLGTRLNYDNYNNYTSDLYYYAISDTPNNIKEWNQYIKLSNNESLNTNIQSKNMYLIQGGNINSDKHTVQFKKDHLNGIETINYGFNQTHLTSLSPKSYQLNYSKLNDDQSNLNINYLRNENSIISDQIGLSNQHKIGYDIENKNNINYYQKELSSTDSRKDSYIKSQHSLTKKIQNFGTINTAFDFYFDTDEDQVTSDIRNHIVQKIPEIDFILNQQQLTKEWRLNQTFQYGFYNEQYYIDSLDQQRVYSQSRFTLNQQLFGFYELEFLNSQLSFNAAYKQFYYASGDQTFTLSNTTQYNTDTFSFLKTETSHHQTWVPTNGNTPFYFDERTQLEKNELKETLTLYYLSDEKYAFKYSSGYNWIVNYQLDNNYELLIHPNKYFKSLFRTSYMLQQHQYSPLVSRFDITPSTMFQTSLQTNYDLNQGEIINLNHIIAGSTSRQWENRWIFKAYFTYAPKNNQNYQLQTLSLTKDLHERKLTLMYNRLLEEFRFQFTINAFPDNNLGFSSNKYESFRLEGVFDDTSVER